MFARIAGFWGMLVAALQGDDRVKKLLCTLLALGALVRPVGAAPCAALTFDDGPSGDNTLALMALLEEKDVRATFFLCGYRIESFPALPEALREAGHELGVHGYSHGCFDAMTPEELRDELSRTAALMGGAPTLLRPPCGAWNGQVRAAAREAGMRIILWSVDPEDWRCRDPEEIARRVCGQVKDGSVILLHDLYPETVEAAGRIIDRLRAGGYELCTVSELARRAGITMEPGQAYSQFDP